MQTRSTNQLTVMVGDFVATIEVIIPLELGGKGGIIEHCGGGGCCSYVFIFHIRLPT